MTDRGHSVRYHRFPLPGIDAMTAATARSFPRHSHDQYGIGIVDSGSHASWSGRGAVEAGPGHFICVNPGEVHDGRALGHAVRSWRILYFEPGLLEQLGVDALEHLSSTWMFAAPVFRDEALRQAFEQAFACTALGTHDRMECESAVVELVGRLSPHSTVDRTPAGLTPGIHRARCRIDDDPATAVSLAELAAEAGISRYQLIRGFTRDLGLPPHAYLLQRRLVLARRLIRAGQGLAEVAAIAGFCDQSHLTRCFTRQFGVPPKRYADAG